MKSIHIQAIIFWLVYEVFTKGSFVFGVSKSATIGNAYLFNMFFSILFGLIFLYIFNHEDFFKFAKEIENKNSKKEKEWEHKLQHSGKLFSSFLIGILSGPLIAALAVRFLQPKSKYKYFLIIIISALSAFFWLWTTRGVIIWRLPF